MRAVQLDRPGGADALTVRDLPAPTRADGGVLSRNG
jgi:NADPH:quinone reductase-like Zn-dependent oxidoreductase